MRRRRRKKKKDKKKKEDKKGGDEEKKKNEDDDDAYQLGEGDETGGEGQVDREEGGGKTGNFVVCVIMLL